MISSRHRSTESNPFEWSRWVPGIPNILQVAPLVRPCAWWLVKVPKMDWKTRIESRWWNRWIGIGPAWLCSTPRSWVSHVFWWECVKNASDQNSPWKGDGHTQRSLWSINSRNLIRIWIDLSLFFESNQLSQPQWKGGWLLACWCPRKETRNVFAQNQQLGE